MTERRVLLAVAGDSAAGKTTISDGIAEIIGRDRVTVVCSDDYHKYGRVARAERSITPLHPECNYLDILAQHLELLRAGEPILKPVYNHSYGELDPPEYVEARDIIIVEGLHPLAVRRLRQVFDVKVFLDPPLELRTRWKVKRDVAKRGYTPEEVRVAMQQREHDSKAYIAPQRSYADIVVSFYEREGRTGDDEHLDVRLVLRPTLAHPSLEHMLPPEHGPIRHRLGRDEGRPVDFLEIDGSAPTEETKLLEDAVYAHFWSESHTIPPEVGRVDEMHSGPLALTQLLIAGHVLEARSLISV
ncbi:MAG TPA: phosphoribulokinase [Acidimicrobiia bacterium]|nr:phosphoribulokinase [Acidimicrobiia bacterium]